MAEFKHFFLTNTSQSESYTATGGGSGTFRSPPRDSREIHGKKLLSQFDSAKTGAAKREMAGEPNVSGTQFVTFAIEGFVGQIDGKRQSGLDLEKLDSESKQIRIISVREEGDRQIATVAVPKGQLDYFETKLSDYIEKDNVRTQKDGSISSKPTSELPLSSL